MQTLAQAAVPGLPTSGGVAPGAAAAAPRFPAPLSRAPSLRAGVLCAAKARPGQARKRAAAKPQPRKEDAALEQAGSKEPEIELAKRLATAELQNTRLYNRRCRERAMLLTDERASGDAGGRLRAIKEHAGEGFVVRVDPPGLDRAAEPAEPVQPPSSGLQGTAAEAVSAFASVQCHNGLRLILKRRACACSAMPCSLASSGLSSTLRTCSLFLPTVSFAAGHHIYEISTIMHNGARDRARKIELLSWTTTSADGRQTSHRVLGEPATVLPPGHECTALASVEADGPTRVLQGAFRVLAQGEQEQAWEEEGIVRLDVALNIPEWCWV